MLLSDVKFEIAVTKMQVFIYDKLITSVWELIENNFISIIYVKAINRSTNFLNYTLCNKRSEL